MSEAQQAVTNSNYRATRFRDWFADQLGVDEDRKLLLYEDLSKAATLLDATYWLQILFAAGIATLGLVLNSPAVIIGAMLISPLMGPILSVVNRRTDDRTGNNALSGQTHTAPFSRFRREVGVGRHFFADMCGDCPGLG